MNFALIVPEAHLEIAARSGAQIVLTPYYLASQTYREFYRKMRKRGDFILVDNGIHEYGYKKSDGWKELIPIICDLHPAVVAIPESHEFDEDLLLRNLDMIADIRAHVNSETEFLFVPRSADLLECQEELQILADLDEDHLITWLGLHMGMETLGKRNFGGRRVLIEALEPEMAAYKLWMFGIYKSPSDEVRSYKHVPRVFGNDSSKPWRLTVRGGRVSEARPYPEPFDFKQCVTDPAIMTHIEQELDEFVSWVEDEEL